MNLFYQYLKSSDAAWSSAFATIVWRPLACSIPFFHQIHAIGGDKWHHRGDGVVCRLLSERRRDFNSYVNPIQFGKKSTMIKKIRQHPVIWTYKRCCLNPGLWYQRKTALTYNFFMIVFLLSLRQYTINPWHIRHLLGTYIPNDVEDVSLSFKRDTS